MRAPSQRKVAHVLHDHDPLFDRRRVMEDRLVVVHLPLQELQHAQVPVEKPVPHEEDDVPGACCPVQQHRAAPDHPVDGSAREVAVDVGVVAAEVQQPGVLGDSALAVPAAAAQKERLLLCHEPLVALPAGGAPHQHTHQHTQRLSVHSCFVFFLQESRHKKKEWDAGGG